MSFDFASNVIELKNWLPFLVLIPWVVTLRVLFWITFTPMDQLIPKLFGTLERNKSSKKKLTRTNLIFISMVMSGGPLWFIIGVVILLVRYAKLPKGIQEQYAKRFKLVSEKKKKIITDQAFGLLGKSSTSKSSSFEQKNRLNSSRIDRKITKRDINNWKTQKPAHVSPHTSAYDKNYNPGVSSSTGSKVGLIFFLIVISVALYAGIFLWENRSIEPDLLPSTSYLELGSQQGPLFL